MDAARDTNNHGEKVLESKNLRIVYINLTKHILTQQLLIFTFPIVHSFPL